MSPRSHYWVPAQDPGQVTFGYWALTRPRTTKWGSGEIFQRIEAQFGHIQIAFGATDGIPEGVTIVDKKNGHDWRSLPFIADSIYDFGYWDPPYHNEKSGPGNRAKLFRPEAREIWRCVKRLAILHTHVYPRAWFAAAIREAMVAVTYGPLKQVRILQIFRKAEGTR